MSQICLPFVPGPVRVPAAVLAAREHDFRSADLEPEFIELYSRVQDQLGTLMGTANRPAIMLGEGMIALWGAMKSCVAPGDRVLSVSTGLFGEELGQMARNLGAEVKQVSFGDDEAADPERVEAAVREFRPRIVTAIHCETPSGVLNPVAEIGSVLNRNEVELYLVDAVASIGGTPLDVDAARIDLCLLGSQKCLSAPPDLGIVSVSPGAWAAVRRVGYRGYDALAPFEHAVEEGWFPYTHSWHALAGLEAACGLLLKEGLPAVYERHDRAALRCREGVRELGLEIFPRDDKYSSPTVTAVKVPDSITWSELNRRFRERGLVVGGNWDRLGGKVFRIGHMGTQAQVGLVDEALGVIGESLRE
jgi:aspartate aminotransferase-like enzyme